ncbi:MAG: 2-amino-4-hydroxy-6-hydroxymethyldihydropteridine diphosphokinase [Desulfurivibrionaceae bacterium]|nr:2-amino-4-hydroxy-6-hydroxymethyldihydropteridine diphosphokinase [Desulfurivibrionaceae bacterium]
MTLAYIGLGSNLGDGCRNLLKAWRMVGEQAGVSGLVLSSPYLTRPVVKDAWLREGCQLSEQWFTNAVGVLETDLSPHELLAALQTVENLLGRDRQKTVDRVADLDILYYDEQVLVDGGLQIPHPGIAERLFVLAPLEELAPDKLHPLTGKTTRQMRRARSFGGDNDLRRMTWPDVQLLHGANQA